MTSHMSAVSASGNCKSVEWDVRQTAVSLAFSRNLAGRFFSPKGNGTKHRRSTPFCVHDG